MVRGLDLFKEYFRGFQESYILIGGAAVDTWMEEVDLRFRATNDLDIILVIEALDKAFVDHLWKFIEEGKYQTKENSSGEPKVYRFIKPVDEHFPYQLEFFSRLPDILGDFEGAHLTPIPLGEDVASLSAILMNDEYYEFARNNAEIVDGLHLLNTPALICLKAKAFLDIKGRLERQEWKTPNERNKLRDDYKKHRADVIRIALILTEEDKIKLEDSMKVGILLYLEAVKSDPPDFKQLAKNFDITEINPEEVFEQLQTTFGL